MLLNKTPNGGRGDVDEPGQPSRSTWSDGFSTLYDR